MYNRRKNETIFAAKWGLTPWQYRVIRKCADKLINVHEGYDFSDFDTIFHIMVSLFEEWGWEVFRGNTSNGILYGRVVTEMNLLGQKIA